MSGWRRVVVLLVVALVVSQFIAAATSYVVFCRQPVETYPALVSMSSGVRTRPLAVTFDPLARLRALAADGLDTLIAVKQSDVVAFPFHALVASYVDAFGCPAESVASQWRKAAMHAWRDEPAALAAARLARASRRMAGADAASEFLANDAERFPWFAANLARVAAYLPRP